MFEAVIKVDTSETKALEGIHRAFTHSPVVNRVHERLAQSVLLAHVLVDSPAELLPAHVALEIAEVAIRRDDAEDCCIELVCDGVVHHVHEEIGEARTVREPMSTCKCTCIWEGVLFNKIGGTTAIGIIQN